MEKLNKIKNILTGIEVFCLFAGACAMDGYTEFGKSLTPIAVLFCISIVTGIASLIVGKEIECEKIRENNRRLFIARHSDALQRYCR